MRFNRLDLNLLVALDALLTERSISRAAERVHISQSTMSHSLGKLREHFEDELLVQVGRKMELTPRGETLCDPIRDVLVRITATVDTQPDFNPARSDREFVLHVSDYSMELLLPHVLSLAQEAQGQGGNIRFKLLPQITRPFRSLERAEVDVLVIPQAYCSPDHPTEPLFEEKYVCMMWRGSRLASSELTLDRYIRARHIVMEPPGTGQPAYEGWFVQNHGISRQIAVSTYSFTAIPSMLVGTELIANLHQRLALRAEKCLPLKIAPLPLEMPPLVQTLQWHKHRSHDPGIVWLRALLKAAVKKMDAASVLPQTATSID